MFWQDVPMIFLWWGTWLLVGLVGWVWTRKIFDGWIDSGYVFGKITGAIITTYIVWLLGMAKVMSFGVGSIMVSLLLNFALGWKLNKHNKSEKRVNWRTVLLVEAVFLILLFGWGFVKGHEPNISGLEKFMDYGFMRSILQSKYFPPADIWFSGKSINYYYFGHLYAAVLTKISGINLAFTFNLMLAALFALTGAMGAVISLKLFEKFDYKWKIFGTITVAYILLFGGNLHTIYAWTQGYSGEEPPPFWKIWGKIPDTYWYPNATRFIPWTIHEFPAYSFVVSDIHGHVLDIPIVLLLIGLLINIFVDRKARLFDLGLFGFVLGCAFMTNALDALVYLGLFTLLFALNNLKPIFNIKNLQLLKPVGLVLIVFVLTTLPFLVTFKSFVNGVAVNCPPKLLENSRFGPIVFEETAKCQKSPVWMMLILWGLFVYGGVWLYFYHDKKNRQETGMLWVSLFCLGLVIFPEFFYFRDIYPQHFRSNTMFKLGYQVFIMMTFVTGYILVKGLHNWRRQFWAALGIIPLLYLVVIYPGFSVKGYFGTVRWDNYKSLNGVEWIRNLYPDNYELLNYLAKTIPAGEQPVILEANGDSYTDYNMFSAFSGLPTVAGWTVHEWLWREGYGPISQRGEEVRKFYEEGNINEAREFLAKYKVKYIVVSNFEKEKYKNLNLEKINLLGTPVFASGETSLYKVN